MGMVRGILADLRRWMLSNGPLPATRVAQSYSVVRLISQESVAVTCAHSSKVKGVEALHNDQSRGNF
jgi:hypothetical protein